jgi:pimeloyl-ACP methyl ester carboxylesterase
MVERSHASTTESAFTGYLDAWVKEDFADAVKDLNTPVLVCIGEHDHAFTREAMESTYLEWFPNARLEVNANSGHYPMQEAPVNLATIMEACIKMNL